MRILRDESGYVLALREWQVLPGGKTSVQEENDPALVAAPIALRPVNCSVPHCCFYCSWCGQPILLPNDRIGSPFSNPDARKIDVRSIATVCHNCKHIGNYSMFRACRGFNTQHKVTIAPRCGETSLVYWLQCVEKTCTCRVPLFVKSEDAESMGESEAAAWLWEELTCASGHTIKKVPIDPRYPLPLRFSPAPR